MPKVATVQYLTQNYGQVNMHRIVSQKTLKHSPSVQSNMVSVGSNGDNSSARASFLNTSGRKEAREEPIYSPWQINTMHTPVNKLEEIQAPYSSFKIGQMTIHQQG